MNPFKARLTAIVFSASALFLSSCLNEEYTGQTAYGDAFIKSVQLNDSTVGYNLQLYAYSWSEMKSVTVYSENDSTEFQLDTIDYKYTFAYRPEVTTYEPQPPEADKYYFSVTFDNDEKAVVTDYLNTNVIVPPQIKKLEWNNDNQTIQLEWHPVTKAQLYSVALIDQSGKMVYETELLEPTINTYHINQFSYGWYTSDKPTETTTFQIVISAFIFEPIASTFDLQCMAVNNLNSIEWKIE